MEERPREAELDEIMKPLVEDRLKYTKELLIGNHIYIKGEDGKIYEKKY